MEIAPGSPAVPVAAPDIDGDLAAYGAAHAAHFARKDPAQALRLWTAYLAGHPRGRFVPEATYNRALALVRLGRNKQAVAALKPIAAGRSVTTGAMRRKPCSARSARPAVPVDSAALATRPRELSQVVGPL